jgi:GNAT superfamily N-acetyltransferase
VKITRLLNDDPRWRSLLQIPEDMEVPPGHALYGVEAEDGDLAGFIWLRGPALRQLAVDQRHRRRGVGRALVRFAVAAGAVELVVRASNDAAVELYLSEGFQVTREYPVGSSDGPIPHYVMRHHSRGPAWSARCATG